MPKALLPHNASSRDALLTIAESSYLDGPVANHKIQNIHPDL